MGNQITLISIKYEFIQLTWDKIKLNLIDYFKNNYKDKAGVKIELLNSIDITNLNSEDFCIWFKKNIYNDWDIPYNLDRWVIFKLEEFEKPNEIGYAFKAELDNLQISTYERFNIL